MASKGTEVRRALLSLMAACLLVCQCYSKPQSRKVTLQGVANARELGNIPVKGGHLRSGWVYRTNSLYKLTNSDVRHLKQLGIRSLVDFRLDADRLQHPDRPEFIQSLAHVYWLPMSVETSPRGYRQLPEQHPRQIRELFEIFSKRDSYPLLYHCAAGKDRTGIVTALLLDLLGADRKIIMADYMASQENGAKFYVQADWMQALLTAVDAAGGIDAYLDRYGVTKVQRKAICSLLIRPGKPARS